MKESTKPTPNLRFREFSGAWKQGNFGDIFNISAGGDVTDAHTSKTKTEAFKYPIYANAKKAMGLYGYSDIFKVSEDCITVAGRGVNIGYAVARTEPFYPIVRLLVLIPKEPSDVKFFQYAIENTHVFVESTGVPQLTVPQISTYSLSYPELQEQRKISSFVDLIDDKIKLLLKQKELFESYKNGCMQAIFSQVLRFRDSSGNAFPHWEEELLGKVVAISKGKQLNRDDMIDHGRFPVINGGMSASGYTDKPNTGGEVITISEGGNSCGYVDWQTEDFWLGGHCYALPVKRNNTVAKFILYSLKWRQDAIMRLRVGSGLPNIQKGDLEKFSIAIPHHDEQLLIADFLSSIDKKIDLVSEELELSHTFRQGLLQQLFV